MCVGRKEDANEGRVSRTIDRYINTNKHCVYKIVTNKKKIVIKVVNNQQNLEIVGKKKEELNKKDNEIKKQFIKISEKINKKIIIVKKETKENNELYASIKPKEIVSLIDKNFQVKVEPSSIELKKEINSVGKFEIQLNFHADVQSSITIEIKKHQAT